MVPMQPQQPIMVQLAAAEPIIMNGAYVPGRGRPKRMAKTFFSETGVSFTSATSLAGARVYSANSQVDPSITGGALQPNGWISLMTDFNHYTGVTAEMRLSYVNNSATPGYIGIVVRDSDVIDTSPSNLRETPFCKVVAMGGSATSTSIGSLSMKANIAQWCSGRSPLGNPVYRGDVINPPQEQVYFHVVAWGAKGGSQETFVDVEIVYKAQYTEPRIKTPGFREHEQVALRSLQEYDRFMHREHVKGSGVPWQELYSQHSSVSGTERDDHKLWAKVDDDVAYDKHKKRQEAHVRELFEEVAAREGVITRLKQSMMIEGKYDPADVALLVEITAEQDARSGDYEHVPSKS